MPILHSVSVNPKIKSYTFAKYPVNIKNMNSYALDARVGLD